MTADGAEWIWNLVADCFLYSEQIVDLHQACEHLAKAFTALNPEEGYKSEGWSKEQQTNLFLGEIHAITGPLDRGGLSDQSRYFHTHQRRMRYQEFREEGIRSDRGQWKAVSNGSRPVSQDLACAEQWPEWIECRSSVELPWQIL